MTALYQQIVTGAIGLGVLAAGVFVFREGDHTLGTTLIAAGAGVLGIALPQIGAKK